MYDPGGNRDILVIGASTGGLSALKTLLSGLPADLPAAVFIVMHVGEISYLAEILRESSDLPVHAAASGVVFERGNVYIAGPGSHLLLHDSHILLVPGPRENLSRPAVDPLFRTAAVSFGSRVIGVVLTGALNDGTAGLAAIKRCGGRAVIQDPLDAAVPAMPESARRHVDIDFSVPLSEMAALLTRLVAEAAHDDLLAPADIRLEAAMTAVQGGSMTANDAIGHKSAFTCPECGGVLWEVADRDVLRYRCHTGHALTAETVLAAQAEESENNLAVLLRSYGERSALLRRMALNERERGRQTLADLLEQRAGDCDADAETVRRLMALALADPMPAAE